MKKAQIKLKNRKNIYDLWKENAAALADAAA